VPRRRAQRLERVLGTPALFATAYGNVGSSIYYALGLTAALALGQSYGIKVVERLARGRQAGPTIIKEANRRRAEIIVLGATHESERMRRDVFGSTIEYVLKHAPCRVMVVSASAPAA